MIYFQNTTMALTEGKMRQKNTNAEKKSKKGGFKTAQHHPP